MPRHGVAFTFSLGAPDSICVGVQRWGKEEGRVDTCGPWRRPPPQPVAHLAALSLLSLDPSFNSGVSPCPLHPAAQSLSGLWLSLTQTPWALAGSPDPQDAGTCPLQPLPLHRSQLTPASRTFLLLC